MRSLSQLPARPFPKPVWGCSTSSPELPGGPGRPVCGVPRREGREGAGTAPGSSALLGRAAAGTRPDWQEPAPSSSSLLFPPPWGGFQPSSALLGEGVRVKKEKRKKQGRKKEGEREKKSQVASPTSPGPAAAAAAPHSWHSWAVTPRAAPAPARPRPRRLQLARPPAPLAPAGHQSPPSRPASLLPAPRGRQQQLRAPGPPRRHRRPQRPPGRPAEVPRGGRAGAAGAALPPQRRCRRQPLPAGRDRRLPRARTKPEPPRCPAGKKPPPSSLEFGRVPAQTLKEPEQRLALGVCGRQRLHGAGCARQRASTAPPGVRRCL